MGIQLAKCGCTAIQQVSCVRELALQHKSSSSSSTLTGTSVHSFQLLRALRISVICSFSLPPMKAVASCLLTVCPLFSADCHSLGSSKDKGQTKEGPSSFCLCEEVTSVALQPGIWNTWTLQLPTCFSSTKVHRTSQH